MKGTVALFGCALCMSCGGGAQAGTGAAVAPHGAGDETTASATAGDETGATSAQGTPAGGGAQAGAASDGSASTAQGATRGDTAGSTSANTTSANTTSANTTSATTTSATTTSATTTSATNPPDHSPVTATTTDEARQAISAAASDIVSLQRMVDPARGLGVYDPSDAGIVQYCDVAHLAADPGTGFTMGIDDPFTCDHGLHRCATHASDHSGYAFILRHGDGDVIWLDAIVHYPRRVPSADPPVVRAFTRAGEGVCALRSTLATADAHPPTNLSVFVSAYTGDVPQSLTQHLCGDEAAQAYAQRVAPHATAGAPDRCERNPARCTFVTHEEEITVYGDDGGVPIAVAVTRPGMRRDLDQGQRRQLEAFLHDVRRQHCDGG